MDRHGLDQPREAVVTRRNAARAGLLMSCRLACIRSARRSGRGADQPMRAVLDGAAGLGGDDPVGARDDTHAASGHVIRG